MIATVAVFLSSLLAAPQNPSLRLPATPQPQEPSSPTVQRPVAEIDRFVRHVARLRAAPVEVERTLQTIAQEFPDVEALIRPYDMTNYTEWFNESFVWNTNWKVLAEGFLEVYHARTIHTNTVAKTLDGRGAVMMLFLFVLMLIGVDSAQSLVETIRGQRIAAILAGVGFGILLIAGIGSAATSGFTGLKEANAGGNVQGLAELIFTRNLWAFELTSALLITAAVGAMVLTHRERFERRKSQRELVVERFRDGGGRATPMPNPGVYARRNSVDTPARLPDGSDAYESVSSVIRSEEPR